jgi:hypothetical protein
MIRVIVVHSLLAGILALAACSSNTPAIPPVRESTTKPQSATVALAPAQPDSPRVDYFNASVRPLLEKQCQPCHFKGGKMYAQLPFDDPQTIHHLGEALSAAFRMKTSGSHSRLLMQHADSTKSAGGWIDY